LADLTIDATSPTAWAKVAIAAMDRFGGQRSLVPYRAVRAHKGKIARAEPVAALYEQGRVSHVRGLGALEDQMCLMARHGYAGSGSPDRVDALVWALQDLILDPAGAWRAPQVRTLP